MNVNFPWKRPMLSMNYFELLWTCFSRMLATDKEKKILCGTYVLQNSHFCIKLPLVACGTFLFSKFACIWLQILHARIQLLKESWVVAMESFLIEFIEAIAQTCSKKSVFEILEELIRKHPQWYTTSDKRV